MTPTDGATDAGATGAMRAGLLRTGAPRVLLLTETRYPERRVHEVARACEAVAGAAFGIVVRDPDRPSPTYVRGLVEAAPQAWLFVKRDDELAHRVRADGVHLGSPPWDLADGARARHVMGALHSDDDARLAAARGLSFGLVSPVFATPGKGLPRGLDALRRSRELAPRMHLYALGGVDARCARACVEAGATGIAVIRALLEAEDVGGSIVQLLAETQRARDEREP